MCLNEDDMLGLDYQARTIAAYIATKVFEICQNVVEQDFVNKINHDIVRQACIWQIMKIGSIYTKVLRVKYNNCDYDLLYLNEKWYVRYNNRIRFLVHSSKAFVENHKIISRLNKELVSKIEKFIIKYH